MTATLTSPTIFASPYPELFGGTVYEQIFNDLTAADAARPAITELTTGKSITYGELKDKADAVAGYLAQRSIGPAASCRCRSRTRSISRSRSSASSARARPSTRSVSS